MTTTTPAARVAPLPGHAGWPLWRRWVIATTLGELVGFAGPALAGVIITRAVAGMPPQVAPFLTLLVLMLAGILEGALLGYAQWRALRHVLPAIGWRAWTGATALAGVVAWFLGMLPNTLVDAAGLGIGALIAAWMVVAPGLLLTIGVAQWLVLRRHLRPAWRWIPANVLGWALGVGATFFGASLITETMPLALAVGIGVASGVAMGLVVGCITGAMLVYLLNRAD